MKYKYLSFITLLIIVVLFSNCNNENNKNDKPINFNSLKEPLIEQNKRMLKTEFQDIDDYINKHKWKMKKTGSGLFYLIYHHGNGKKIVSKDTVSMNFEIKFLSGEICYSSKESGVKKFIVGRSHVEKGMDEGILLLNYGDKAKFILPSHLAFGLTGDNNKIPPKATLIYDVEILLNDNKN